MGTILVGGSSGGCKRLHAKSTTAPTVAGIALVPAAAHMPAAERTVLEAPPIVEVPVAAFVAAREPRHTWHQHPEVGSTHFEEVQHPLDRPEPGVASRPSLRHPHFGCRPEEQQLP